MVALLSSLGRQVLSFLAFFGQLTQLVAAALGEIVRGAIPGRLVVDQVASIGFNSLPVAAVTLFFSGMVFAYHTATRAASIGAGGLVGWLVAETMCRELGPAMVAIVVSARAGSAMAAEIGTMKVTEQIDALRAMAVSPIVYLVVPRLVACLLMVPALAFLGDIIGVMGGYSMSAVTSTINGYSYLENIRLHVATWTIVAGVLKGIFFGGIIAIVGCHQGLTCRQASEEVGRATTRAVVYCIMLVYAADLVLTRLLYSPV